RDAGRPRPEARVASRLTLARGARGARGSGPGRLLPDLALSFLDVVDALDQLRFRRHWQRRVQPGDPDLVTLTDVKNVVLFQVQQRLPPLFLKLFHTAAVDRFLRTLILYLFHYMQACEWLAQRCEHGGPALQRRQGELCALRVLLARDYLPLVLGLGPLRRYHHLASGVQSWTHRDARLFEPLLRLAVRIAWVALGRRNLNLIDAEHSAAVQELLGLLARPGQPQPAPTWTLLGLGLRGLPQPDLPETLRALGAVYTLGEEELSQRHGLFVGILGMQRAQFDVMLNPRDQQRRQDLLCSS
ncbi:Protein phosphatase 1 regulatory subunit 36, partial [Frankliniella fusca]